MSEDQEAIVADRESAAHSDNRLQLRVWFRLLTVFKMIEGKLRTKLRTKFDVSIPHFGDLAILDAKKEPMTMGELSAGLMVTTGNVTGIVDTMIEEGLVTRSPILRIDAAILFRSRRSGIRCLATLLQHLPNGSRKQCRRCPNPKLCCFSNFSASSRSPLASGTSNKGDCAGYPCLSCRELPARRRGGGDSPKGVSSRM